MQSQEGAPIISNQSLQSQEVALDTADESVSRASKKRKNENIDPKIKLTTLDDIKELKYQYEYEANDDNTASNDL